MRRPCATMRDHGQQSEQLSAPVKTVARLSQKTLPSLLEAHELARLIGWERRRAVRLLEDYKLLQPQPDPAARRRYLVDTYELRQRLPAAYAELERRWEAGELPQPQRRTYKRRATAGDHARPRATTRGGTR